MIKWSGTLFMVLAQWSKFNHLLRQAFWGVVPLMCTAVFPHRYQGEPPL